MSKNPILIYRARGAAKPIWRLMADGRVERTSGKGRYQPWITGERIPVAITREAEARGITIQPGRPACCRPAPQPLIKYRYAK
jgi:hypothetical protein